MYIPLWVIIVGAIILFIYLRNREKERTENMPLTPEEIEAEKSLSKISKHWQHESDVNTFIEPEKIDAILQAHEKKVAKVKDDANKVRNERDELDRELMFSQRLWQFVDDIMYYPDWYKNSKNEDGTPYWKSKTIKPNELVLKKFLASNLSKLVEDKDKFGKDDEILEYTFEVDGNRYTLYINREINRQDDNLFGSEKWEPIYYYPVFVYENDERLVYQAKLYYESGQYADSYDHYYLEAFKPGRWTKFLLEKIFAVRAEEEKSSREFREKMNKEMEKETKEKFVD